MTAIRIDQRKMWRWFVRGEATYFLPTMIAVVFAGDEFSHAITRGSMTSEGMEDLKVYHGEAALLEDFSEAPMIREVNFYSVAREREEARDRGRSLLAAAAAGASCVCSTGAALTVTEL